MGRLPDLAWSGGNSGGQGLIPMPISMSQAFGGQADDEESSGRPATDYSIAGAPAVCCLSMSWKERMIGFVGCFSAGCFFELISFASWHWLLLGNSARFAFTYTLGQILFIVSTLFLVGPRRQWQAMAAPSRKIAFFVYVSCIAFT